MACVFKRKDSWWIDYYYQGVRHRQKIGPKRKAEEALTQIRTKIASGDYLPPDSRSSVHGVVTFAEFALDEFLPWSEMQHAQSHHDRLCFALSKHLYPVFGGLALSEITIKQIEDYKGARRRARNRGGKPVSEATVNRELCALKVVLKKAVTWGKLEVSPAASVKTYKESPSAPRLLELQEIQGLLDEAPQHLRALVSVVVHAGLRSAEIYRLQWRDIDWKAGELTVASRRGGHTKSYKSRRIPMGTQLVEDLRRHPRSLKSLYVFCNSEGEPYRSVRRSLKAAAARAGIEDFIGLHQLRHAFCSHCQMQGIDPRTVQGWMGHKDITTTLRYAHVSPDHEKAAIQRLRYDTRHQLDTSIHS